jgi:hypothetical protein
MSDLAREKCFICWLVGVRALTLIQGSGQSDVVQGDEARVSTSSSCEDPTQNLTPFLEQQEDEASKNELCTYLL